MEKIQGKKSALKTILPKVKQQTPFYGD